MCLKRARRWATSSFGGEGIQRIEFQWSTILGTSNFGGKAHGHFKGWGKADWAFQVLNV